MNFKVTKEGDVYKVISPRTAKVIKRWVKDAPEILLISGEDAVVANSVKDIKRHIGEIGLHVGQVREFICARTELFPTLKSVYEYFQENATLPWGIRTLIIRHGWSNYEVFDPDSPYKHIIKDKELGQELRVKKNKGGIEYYENE